MKNYDYLVIGSGIGGLIFALEASKKGAVAIVSKEKLSTCNTEYAQGGIAAVINKEDAFENHIQDTFTAGAELGKISVIRKIIEEGPDLIDYLIKIGTDFNKENIRLDRSIENIALTREGGHSHKRIAFAADSTGHEVEKALIARVRENANIDIYENQMAVDLITQHHVYETDEFIPQRTCWGAYILNTENNKVTAFRAKKTMLATGGGSQVYSHTTNPEVATGDGYAMAHLAGARVANMEFVQFHPTAFYSPTGDTFLISEAVRGEGAILRLQNGETFMEKYHKLGSLAPRDIVSRAIELEIKKRGEKFAYLDATGIDRDKLKNHFKFIDYKLTKRGIDFTKEPIPIAPAAHYFCGGVLSTVDGLTDIKNLFVAGESACTGLHGANRLASNSLLEAGVIAYRASKHPSMDQDVEFPSIMEWQDVGEFNENEWVIISHNNEIIKTIMNGYVGITRSRRLLKYALKRIDNIYTEINNFYQHNPVKKEVIETRNLAIVAQLIIRAAISRKESRGAHSVIDYPNRDDLNFKKDTII